MSKYFKLGLHQDLAGNYDSAIDYYIKSVENEEMILDSHLNLIVILIEVVFDYGVSSDLINKGIFSQQDIDKFSDYLNSLLKKTEILFESSEIMFWKYFIESYYYEVEREKLMDIIDLDPNNLVPYHQLYITDLGLHMDTECYKTKIDKLKKKLLDQPTIKNKYIFSLINGVEDQLI